MIKQKNKKQPSIKKILMDLIKPLNLKERAKNFKQIEEFLIENKTSMLLPDGVPKLPEPDKTGKSYPLYEPVKDKIHPYDFLKNHPLWPKMLKHFSPNLERDYLFQDQLQMLDKSLYISLKNKRQSMKKNIGVNIFDIISSKSVRISHEIESINEIDLQETGKIFNAARRRQTREQKK